MFNSIHVYFMLLHSVPFHFIVLNVIYFVLFYFILFCFISRYATLLLFLLFVHCLILFTLFYFTLFIIPFSLYFLVFPSLPFILLFQLFFSVGVVPLVAHVLQLTSVSMNAAVQPFQYASLFDDARQLYLVALSAAFCVAFLRRSKPSVRHFDAARDSRGLYRGFK